MSSLGHAVRPRELPAPTPGTSVQGNQTRARDPAPPLPCLKARTTRTAPPPFSSRSCSFCFLSSDSNYLPAGCDRHNQVSVCHTPKKFKGTLQAKGTTSRAQHVPLCLASAQEFPFSPVSPNAPQGNKQTTGRHSPLHHQGTFLFQGPVGIDFYGVVIVQQIL